LAQDLNLRRSILIGVISDTHGLLRPEAIEALRGAAHIIHAGDIGSPEILIELSAIAPLTAIRGNIDKGAWARKLPETEVLDVAGVSIYVLHNLEQLDLKPKAAGFSVVISGHSHVPKQETRDGVLYFNPGSAGPRRFKSPHRREAHCRKWTHRRRTCAAVDHQIVADLKPLLQFQTNVHRVSNRCPGQRRSRRPPAHAAQ
jgi:putative phosphoesterase